MSRKSVAAAAMAYDDNLTAMSNAELRELLAHHGFPNQPVTSTTRNVLISRLRKKLAEGGSNSKVRHTTNYLARYSSAEEESDRETAPRTKASTSPQQHNNSPSNMPPPPASKRKRATNQGSFSLFSPSMTSSTVGGGSPQYSSNTLPIIKVPIQSRNSVYIPPPAVHSSDTEESDSGGGGKGSRNSASANPYLSYGRLSGLSFPKRYSPQLDSAAPRTSHFNNNSPLIRQRSNYNHGNTEALTRLSETNNSSSGTEDSPYVSDFTKRLLQFRDRNLTQQQEQQHPGTDRRADNRPVLPPNSRYFYRPRFTGEVVHQAGENHAGSRSSSSSSGGSSNNSISKSSFSAGGMFGNLFSRLDQQYGFKQTLVPFVLVGALVLFFAFLVFMYLTISPDLVSTITTQSAQYKLCGGDDYPAENCIFENDIDLALDFLRLIAPELQQRVERHMCKDPGLPFILTAAEAVKMRVNSLMNHDEYDTQRQLLNMEYLIDLNPQWHISNLNADDGQPLTIEEVRQAHSADQTSGFGILKPRLPLTCLFLRKLQTFFFVVGTLGLASLLAYLGNMFYKYTVRQKQLRSEKLKWIISQILQIVMEQAGNFPRNAEAAAVVVNHLRDKIIPPAQRTKEQEGLWREAIVFLEHNESRVQFEMGTRNGEDCRLVRWVDTVQTPPRVSMAVPMQTTSQLGQSSSVANGGASSSSPINLYNSAALSKVGEAMLTAKKWQSPAFDNANKIVSPPTQCLKIRQMFDKYEAINPNLKTIIADAILEKVGPTCKVYDIQLEKQACCVYVRCATAKDAGMVHDEINGWWFDNRLVSIKFLRLERFMDRFPDSVNSRHLLRPSNPQKLSLTQCNTEVGGVGFEEDDDENDLEMMNGED